MKLIVGIMLSAASLLAYADGGPQQYDQAIVNQMSLDPNESVVNDDGAVEAPDAKMSGTARAFRNGVSQGRKMQQDANRQDDIPPLPADMPPDNQKWSSIPPQPRQQVVQAPPQQYVPRPPVQVVQQAEAPEQAVQDPNFDPQRWVSQQVQAPQQSSQQYAQPQGNYQTSTTTRYSTTSTQTYSTPPVAPVYPQAPQYYTQAPQPVYAPAQPVYTPPPGPPSATYVIIRGIPPTLATGYWPRGYQPMYAPQPRYYAPRSRGYGQDW